MRAAAAIALVAVLAAGVQARQPSTPDAYLIYREAVAAYVQSGDISRAVVPLEKFSKVEFDAATKATMAARNAGQLRAAAVFHLEIGVALAGISLGASAGHFKYGSDLLDRWTAVQPFVGAATGEAEKAFRAMWFGVAGSAFLAVRDIGRARPLVEKVSSIQPRSARTRTLSGMVHELEASLNKPDVAPTLRRRELSRRDQMLRLSSAERDYREALRLDENYAPALVRLGRVLHLLSRVRDARESLERGQRLAKDDGTRYAAALFMGALKQDEQDLEGARQSYEQALALAPTSQTATVALAHLEVMAGRPDRAGAVARRLVDASVAGQPWWASQYGALDLEGLRSLREQVGQ
jgi:tetratricopeptide (TPR) repeat protein